MFGEAGFRRPRVSNRGRAILRPSPIHTSVERFGETPHFALLERRSVEIRGGGQHPGDQNGRIDGRQLALPGALAGGDVEEVIEEPAMPAGFRVRAVLRVPEKTERRQRAFDRLRSRDIPALHRDGVARQGEADAGDAGRDVVGHRVVANQAILWVRFLPEIPKRIAFQGLKVRVLIGDPTASRLGITGAHAEARSSVMAATAWAGSSTSTTTRLPAHVDRHASRVISELS